MKFDKLEKFDATSNADRSAGIESRYAYDADEVDAAIAELKDENSKLKRALWLARAERARDDSILLPSKFMRNVWDNVESKCRSKAEEYK